MNNRLLRFPFALSMASMSKVVWLGGACVIAVLVLSAVFATVALREKEVRDWRRQMSSMTLVLAEQMADSLMSASSVLDDVVEHVQRMHIRDPAGMKARLSGRDVHELLKAKITGLPVVDVASIVNADGQNINFSRSHPMPSINLADRDYFLHHSRQPGNEEFLSEPVRNKANGKWTFYLSRRLSAENGQFLGLALVGISIEKISAFHEKVASNLGQNASISVLREDMKLMSRWPFREHMMGAVNRTGSAYQLVKVEKKREGTILTNSPRFSTGAPDMRMGAVQPVGKYPLYMLSVVTDDLYLSVWRRSAMFIGGGTLLTVALVLLVIFFLDRSLRRREADMREMDRLRTEAVAASQAKSSFLATMSHEIRTPMNGILGMAQLMQGSGVGERERMDYAATILSSGRTLLTLLNDVLDYSKVEAGKMELVLEDGAPGQIMEEVSKLFFVAARSKGLSLVSQWQGAETARYRIDGIRVRQMVSNLVGNAVKFSTRGTIDLCARELSREAGHAVLEFRVTDQGPGISEEDQDRLFSPFVQADNSTTRRHGGSGLGLSTVRGLARLMGGDAGVHSVEGEGAAFWFTVKVEVAPEDSPATLDRAGSQVPVCADAEASGVQILVAEDDPTNQLVISAMLSRAGHQVRIVENGQLALDAATHQPRPDLVIMDVQMPVMDGLDATRAIRFWEQEHDQKAIPIVALTAGAFQVDRQRCLEAGMNEFLTKPVLLGDVRRVVASLLRSV
jgi:two-component system, sensor histidine kinase